MSVSFLLAQYELKEDMEKFLKSVSLSLLKKLHLQRAITWQKECIETELKRRIANGENLKPQRDSEFQQGSASYTLSTLLATQTWF